MLLALPRMWILRFEEILKIGFDAKNTEKCLPLTVP